MFCLRFPEHAAAVCSPSRRATKISRTSAGRVSLAQVAARLSDKRGVAGTNLVRVEIFLSVVTFVVSRDNSRD